LRPEVALAVDERLEDPAGALEFFWWDHTADDDEPVLQQLGPILVHADKIVCCQKRITTIPRKVPIIRPRVIVSHRWPRVCSFMSDLAAVGLLMSYRSPRGRTFAVIPLTLSHRK
jgi:hypothetical protein